MTASAGTASTNTNYFQAMPIYIPSTTTFDRIGVTTTSVTTGGNIRLGIYSDNAGLPSTLVLDSGVIAYSANSTAYMATISQTLTAGWYWLGSVIQSGSSTWLGYGAYPTQGMSGLMLSNTSGSLIICAYQTGVTGALPSTLSSPAISGYSQPVVYLRTA